MLTVPQNLNTLKNSPNAHNSEISCKLKKKFQILIDPHTGVAYGVKFKRNGKMWIVHARKEIILSAGSLFFQF
jgi:hypothetical protein